MNEFSALKAAWHIEKIAELRAGRDIVPTHVQLILSDRCNQNCAFCSYRMEGGFSTQNFPDEQGNKNPNRRIETAKALEILDDCAAAGVEAIEFTGGGEPTVHPEWARVIGAKYYDGILDAIGQARAEARTLETDAFKVVDYFGNRIADLEQHAPDYSFCGEQQFVAYIGGDLRVYSCCTNAYTDAGRVGDLRNMRFSEWIKTRRQMAFDARGCHTCQFHSTNKNINYLLDPAPAHVGFV